MRVAQNLSPEQLATKHLEKLQARSEREFVHTLRHTGVGSRLANIYQLARFLRLLAQSVHWLARGCSIYCALLLCIRAADNAFGFTHVDFLPLSSLTSGWLTLTLLVLLALWLAGWTLHTIARLFCKDFRSRNERWAAKNFGREQHKRMLNIAIELHNFGVAIRENNPEETDFAGPVSPFPDHYLPPIP